MKDKKYELNTKSSWLTNHEFTYTSDLASSHHPPINKTKRWPDVLWFGWSFFSYDFSDDITVGQLIHYSFIKKFDAIVRSGTHATLEIRDMIKTMSTSYSCLTFICIFRTSNYFKVTRFNILWLIQGAMTLIFWDRF